MGKWMKKWWISFNVLIVFVIIWGFYYTHPKDIHRSIRGVEYRLGSNNEPKPVTIGINGKLQRSLFGKKTFAGKIDLTGVSQPNLEDKDKQLIINFQENGAGVITYSYYKDGQPILRSYGVLFINKDFSKVAIEEYEPANNGGGIWEAGNGLIITGPAKTKKKALQIANELMENMLNGYELK
ncbi:hypothetical protein [Bacillus sp. FJAT-49736]|uniref:hypothetical protein n=1 Tax=Bacillus sp. FJAT-49736 TaxID=2833582 RepID=UPI001BCA4E31|nr:hypothetical protein [Bacillus sp. FJAT-49736]MBS4172730.1 hypothetical protein [Bacillus sp. FJAT-49736]